MSRAVENATLKTSIVSFPNAARAVTLMYTKVSEAPTVRGVIRSMGGKRIKRLTMTSGRFVSVERMICSLASDAMEPIGDENSQERGQSVSAVTVIHISGASGRSVAIATTNKLFSRAPSSTHEQASGLRDPTASSTVAHVTRGASMGVSRSTASSAIKIPFRRPLVGAVTILRTAQRLSLTVQIAIAPTASSGRDPAPAVVSAEVVG